LFDLWCCIVSIDYNQNFFVFSRASHKVRLFYVFGFFIVLLLWFLSSIEQQVCLFCFFFPSFVTLSLVIVITLHVDNFLFFITIIVFMFWVCALWCYCFFCLLISLSILLFIISCI
jgi:hypothetical protein